MLTSSSLAVRGDALALQHGASVRRFASPHKVTNSARVSLMQSYGAAWSINRVSETAGRTVFTDDSWQLMQAALAVWPLSGGVCNLRLQVGPKQSS